MDDDTTKVLDWYLAASKPRQEVRAVENLGNQQIFAFCPTVKVEKLIRIKKMIVEEALFPGYVFVNVSLTSPFWSKIRSTRGIRDWVKFAGKPAKLPNELVESLVKLGGSPENQAVIRRFGKGEKVRILSGPFIGLSAVFEKDDGEKRSMILVEFLGKKARLAVPNEHITANC